MVFALVFACSTDDSDDGMNDDDQIGMEDDGMMDDDSSDDNPDDSNDDMTTGDLVGLWALSDIRFDETMDNDDLEFAKEIVAFLIDQECYLVTFDFMDDGTVTADSKVNFLEINVGVGGLDIPCPEESEVETTLWMLDGDQLTFVNDMQEEETITITFEGDDTFIVDGAAIDENNYDGGEAVFTRLPQ